MAREDAGNTPAIDRYARGIRYYREGLWQKAADVLEGLLHCPEAIGRPARYIYSLARRALGAAATARGEFVEAAEHLAGAATAAGLNCGRPSRAFGVLPTPDGMSGCLRQLERAPAAGGGSAGRCRKLAQAQWQAGQREAAYMTLTRGLRRFGSRGGLHLQMGLFLAAEEQYDRARAAMTQAVEADCDDPNAHRCLALVAAAQGDLAESVRAFQRAVELRPDDLLVAYELVVTAGAAADSGLSVRVRLPDPADGPTDERLAALAAYVAAEPDFADALASLPDGRDDDDLLALLAGAVELALVSEPRHADLHRVASQVLARMGQTEAAIEHAHRALSLNPRYLQARVQLADLYAEADRIEEAVEAYCRAVADGADWPDVHFRAAELLLRARRPEEARLHLRRALQLNESYAPAADALAALAA